MSESKKTKYYVLDKKIKDFSNGEFKIKNSNLVSSLTEEIILIEKDFPCYKNNVDINDFAQDLVNMAKAVSYYKIGIGEPTVIAVPKYKSICDANIHFHSEKIVKLFYGICVLTSDESPNQSFILPLRFVPIIREKAQQNLEKAILECSKRIIPENIRSFGCVSSLTLLTSRKIRKILTLNKKNIFLNIANVHKIHEIKRNQNNMDFVSLVFHETKKENQGFASIIKLSKNDLEIGKNVIINNKH